MHSKTILVLRDRPRLDFQSLVNSGILPYWSTNIREAYDELNRHATLHCVLVDLQESVERGLEFCEIVHITRPAVPIVFVRSANRPSLEPLCAHRILEPDVSEDELTDAVFTIFADASDRRSA